MTLSLVKLIIMNITRRSIASFRTGNRSHSSFVTAALKTRPLISHVLIHRVGGVGDLVEEEEIVEEEEEGEEGEEGGLGVEEGDEDEGNVLYDEIFNF